MCFFFILICAFIVFSFQNVKKKKMFYLFIYKRKYEQFDQDQDQDQDSLLVKRRNDNHSPGLVIRELVLSSHQRSELRWVGRQTQ